MKLNFKKNKDSENEIVSEPKRTKIQNFQRQQSNNLNKFSGLLISTGVFLLAGYYQDLLEPDSIEEIVEKSNSARFKVQAEGVLMVNQS